jgi:drug/metabolite transporter (DMT)-like permease
VRRGAAALGLGIGVLAMSWGAPLARLTAAAPLAVAMWRMTLATGLLLPVAMFRGGWQPIVRRGRAAVLAGVLLGLHFGLWIPSLWLTSVSASVVLVATQPLVVLLLSPRLLGVAIRTVNLVSFLLAIVGVALISWGDLLVSSRALLGDAMALGGAFAGAGYVVVGKRLRAEVPLDRYLSVVYGGAAIVLIAAVAALPVPSWPYDAISWLPLFAMAIGPTLTGHTLLNWSLAYLEAYKVNLALLLEPVLASLWTWLVLAQAPPTHVLPGGMLVLLALALEYFPRGGGGRQKAREIEPTAAAPP